MMIQKTNEAKDLLKRFNELINEASETKEYNHTAEITNIAKKVQSMKLKDEFLINALSEDELKTFDFALVLANTVK